MSGSTNGKRRFVVASILLCGLFSLAIEVHSRDSSVPHPDDQEVINRFIQIYYHTGVWWDKTRWLGIRSLQNPADNWAMQEIIAEVKPDFVVETGAFSGGTALFYASVLGLVNEGGKVITVDTSPQVDEASKLKIFRERVEVIKGDSVSPEVVEQIAARVKDHTVLVTLDSLHTKQHVLKEMELYSRFVSLNSYLVVQDTVVNGHPLLPDYGEGPMEAVEEFLKTHKEFTIDHAREKFLLTFYPSGYLKRIH